ncbi:MAG: translation initiation factor IF-2 N-terminal domain-containing protein, partial [Verrucomicrobiota bacterium]
MPVRIYEISKKLGIENKQVLAKAKELGITTAKVASSSLDKITAEFLEQHLIALKPVEAAPVIVPAPPPDPIKIISQPVESPAEILPTPIPVEEK